MPREGLPAHPVADVPQLRGGIAGSRHKRPHVWAQGEAHHIPGVPSERGGLLASLNVPQSTADEVNATSVIISEFKYEIKIKALEEKKKKKEGRGSGGRPIGLKNSPSGVS